MSVRSAQSVTVLFTTRVFATGVGTNADSLPTGTLYLNGVSNAATVTVTNISAGLYKAAVTLPTLAIGDEVEIIIAATVSSVSDTAVVWGDTKDVLLDASGNAAANVVQLLGTAWLAPAVAGTPDVNAKQIGGQAAALDANNLLKVDVEDWHTVAVTTTVPLAASAYTAPDNADIVTALSDVATILADVNTGAGAIYTRIGAPVGASISADIAAAKASIGSPQQAGSAVTLPANPPAGFIVAASFGAAAITSTVAPNLDAAVSSRSTYAGGDTAGTTTLLTRIPAAAALASQIPANFTAALFASAGVFSVGALANAPAGGGGGGSDPLLNQVPGSYASGTAGAALGRIGSGQIVTVSPVAQNGDFTLVQGATYYAADGQSIDFTEAGAAWPDLTSGSVQLRGYFGSQLYTHAGSIVTAGGSSQKVRFEFSATDTAGYALGSRPFDVLATLANGHAVLLASVQGAINAL